MKYGNCLLGLIWILLTAEEKGRVIIRKSKYDWVPHLMFRTNKGVYHHYKLVSDCAPFPFCYLVFQGKFVRARTVKG